MAQFWREHQALLTVLGAFAWLLFVMAVPFLAYGLYLVIDWLI
jgi:hypothetical protein